MDDLDGRPVGRRIAVFRKRAGLTQAGLAHRLHRSKSWVEKVERGERQLDSFRVMMEVASALGVQVRDLREDLDPLRPGHEVLPDLRWSLTTRALDRVEPRDLDQLGRAVRAVWDRYDADAHPYSAAAPDVPMLVAELRALVPQSSGGAQRDAARSLSLAAGLASRIARELGQVDLAWIASDLALRSAQEAGDLAYIGAAASRVARAALRDGRTDEAWTVAEEFAAPLRPTVGDAPDSLTIAAFGTLRLVTAITAARSGDRQEAAEALTDARRVADLLDRDGNELWTAFGPANVGVHEAAVALEFGDPDAALAISRQIDITMLQHNERRATHRVQMAQASVMRRRDDDAVRHLQAALVVAPEGLPYDTLAREMVHVMLHRKGRRPASLRSLATALRVDD